MFTNVCDQFLFSHERSGAVLVAGLPVGALEVLLAVVRVRQQLPIACTGRTLGWKMEIQELRLQLHVDEVLRNKFVLESHHVTSVLVLQNRS